MRVTFFDINPSLVEEWAEAFDGLTEVEFQNAALTEIESHDLLVSPANSFGMMDGGLDAAIAALLPGVQEAVHNEIAHAYFGEQPVGTSMLVQTGHERFPWLAHTPTMRYPRQIVPEAVYDATRAVFMAVRHHNDEAVPEDRIETIACPGLGTLSGGISPRTGARMMKAGYESVMRPKRTHYKSWVAVEDYLRAVYG